MGDTPSHGSQGTNSSGSSGAPASAGGADDLARRLDGLEASLSAFIGGFDAKLNGLLTKRFKGATLPADDDGAGSGAGDPASKGGKPADPAFAKLQRDFDALQKQLTARDAEAKAAARETALRAAIAKSGIALVDTEAAFAVVGRDFEPDEDGGLRPRDPAHIGKPLEQLVKSRLTAMPFLHAATGKASGAGAGAAKPAGAGEVWRFKDGATSEDLFAEADRLREAQAAAAAAG